MFPDIGTDRFLDRVAKKTEFSTFGEIKEPPAYTDYSLKTFQKFVRNWMSPNTPYKNLLLYWSPGSGKTTGALTITEQYIPYIKIINSIYPDIQPRIYIITKTKMAGIQFMDTILDPRLTNYKYIGKKPYTEYLGATTKFSEDPTRDNYDRYRAIQKYIQKEILVPKNDFYYEFLTYTKIQRKGTAFADDWESKNFEYSFFIFDEMHEVEGNNAEQIVMELKRRTENLRLVLLSATPVNTAASEFVTVLNILRPLEQRLDINEYFDSTTGEPVHGNTTLQELAKLSSGYISYVKITDDLFPERIDEGTLTKPFTYLRFVRCLASPAHQKLTLKYMKEHEFMDISNVMTEYQTINNWDTVFPTGRGNVEFYTEKNFSARAMQPVIETDEFERHEDILDKKLLNVKNVHNISPKIAELIKTVINKEGLHFIIHRQIINGGVQLIVNTLRVNGFIKYGEAAVSTTRCYKCGVPRNKHGKITDHEYRPAAYVALYRNVDTVDRIRAMNSLKDPGNRFGENVKIVVGSVIIRQSVDFKYLRHIHIMNSQESLSMDLQIIGRGIRINSHALLPPDMRNVRVYRYIVDMPLLKKHFGNIYNPEEYKYWRQEENFITNQTLEYYIKQSAMDCQINKYINVSNFLLSASKKNKSRFSIMCNFHECDYKCEQPVLYKPSKRDKSTVSIVSDNSVIEECETAIEFIMKRTPAIKVPQLLDATVDILTRSNAGVAPLLDMSLLMLAVLNVTTGNRIISNVFKQLGVIEWHGGAVFFVPILGASQDPLKNLKYYRTSNTINLENIPGLYSKYDFAEIKENVIEDLSASDLTAVDFSEILAELAAEDQIVIIEHIIKSGAEPAITYIREQYGKFLVTKSILAKSTQSFIVRTTDQVKRLKDTDIIGHVLGGKFRCLTKGVWGECVGKAFVLSAKSPNLELGEYVGFEDTNSSGKLVFKVFVNDASGETDNRKKRKGLDCMSFRIKEVRDKFAKFFNVPPATFPLRGKRSFCDMLRELLIKKDDSSKRVFYLSLLEVTFARRTKQIDF